MCDCYSTNGDHGTVPNVVLAPPDRFAATRTVSVDACIAPVIEALWAEGIWTYGCCCGHGRQVGRSVCVENHNREAAAKVVRGMGDTAEILAYELVAGDALPVEEDALAAGFTARRIGGGIYRPYVCPDCGGNSSEGHTPTCPAIQPVWPSES